MWVYETTVYSFNIVLVGNEQIIFSVDVWHFMINKSSESYGLRS